MINNTDQMIKEAVEISLAKGLIKCGDLIVITAGVPVGVTGHDQPAQGAHRRRGPGAGDRDRQPGGGRQGAYL